MTRTSKTVSRKPLAAAVGTALAAAFSLNASAQEIILEEVIITSQLRAQNVMEVPNSVSAVSGDKIERMGIENLQDLTAFVPSLHFTETGISTQMRIRGIGSDNSQGFEQSVGVYMDGVFRGRAQLFRAPIYDMERVEVMRGPQGTLFGKNAIAGALDLITAKPTDELRAQVSTTYETEFGTTEYSGFLSGPLSENVHGRVAVRYLDDPGFMVNTILDRDEPQQEEKSIRISLGWTPHNDLDVMFIAEHANFEVHGRPMEITLDRPAPEGHPREGISFSQSLAGFGLPSFDPNISYTRQVNTPEFSDNTINSQTLRLDYRAGDYTISSISGIVRFDYDERCECDFTPANLFHLDMEEEYSQFSQEFRILSPENRPVEWLAGVFYQEYDQAFNDVFRVPVDSLLPPIINAGLDQAGRPPLPDSFRGTGVAREFEQSSEAWAVFGEATWRATEDFRITLGGRFTEEKKDATKVLNIVNVAQGDAVITDSDVAGDLAPVYLGIFATDTEQTAFIGGAGHNLVGSRKESIFTPSLTLQYDLHEDTLGYAKVSRGFKAGGFDPRSNNRNFFEFSEETVIAYEAGAKMRSGGGRSELNLAVFMMDYEDLQIAQFDGAVGFNVGNAKETRVQGFEIDGRWQINNYLSSGYGVTYLGFEYKDFENGNCHYGQEATSPGGGCDYTGLRGVYTPQWMVNGSLEYARSLNADILFVGNMDLQWVDSQNVHVNLDPRGNIDAYTMLSARIALESEHWELALLGKNLLNEEVVTYSANVPLSETMFGTNTHYSFLQRPRTIALAATLKY